jgi:uncharacterized protein YbjT (DUF2867 family)
MYAVVGASGNTGGATARALLSAEAAVRAVVRDAARAEALKAKGAEVAVADLDDVDSLARAFEGARAAYVLNPPAYADPDLFARARSLAGNIAEAVRRAGLARLVVLSSMGAHLEAGSGNIGTNRIFERALGALACETVFLRPAYFMENWAWVAPVAAQALRDASLSGVIQLEGPSPCSADDAARAFAAALGRPVAAVPVPEEEWGPNLEKSGFTPRTIAAWVEMFRGFNSGAIGFEARGTPPLRGTVSLDEAVRAIVQWR